MNKYWLTSIPLVAILPVIAWQIKDRYISADANEWLLLIKDGELRKAAVGMHWLFGHIHSFSLYYSFSLLQFLVFDHHVLNHLDLHLDDLQIGEGSNYFAFHLQSDERLL